MNDPSSPAPLVLKRVFHPSDISAMSRNAYVHALKIALQVQGELVVFHVAKQVATPEAPVFPDPLAVLHAWGLVPEEAKEAALNDLGVTIHHIANPGPDPVETALYYLERTPADLLVMATQARQGLTRVINRAVAEPVASDAQAAVLFLPQNVPGFVDADSGAVDLDHILVLVAEQPSHRYTLEFIAGLLLLLNVDNARITLLHVSDSGEFPPIEIPEVLAGCCQKVVKQGSLVAVVNDFATQESVKLTVLTSQGRRGLVKVLLGGNTEQVLRDSSSAVLAVPCRD